METTTINDRPVPIWPSGLITLQFSAGRNGPKDAGFWEFWTVFNDTGHASARCRPGEDPGERFRRMEGEQSDGKGWVIARAAAGIRWANSREVEAWLDGHSEDVRFIISADLSGAFLKLVRNGSTLRLELS
jgi:hypothetical protein